MFGKNDHSWFSLCFLSLCSLCLCGSLSSAEQPPDLSDYRTVATAQTATPAALVGGGERLPGYLGVNAEPDAGSLRVAVVEPESPAARADIRPGDRLKTVDGTTVADLAALRDVLLNRREGDRLVIVGTRDNKLIDFVVTLGAPSHPMNADLSPRGRGRYSQDDMPNLARWDDRRPRVFRGEKYRLAVIEVAFPDAKLNEKITNAEWEKALFSKGEYKDRSITGQPVYGSMNDYYQEMSCGKFSVTGKVFAPVTVAKKRSEYTTTPNRFTLLTEAADLLLARDGKDALKDFDGLFFIYAGNRVQTQRGGIFWPHKANFSHDRRRWNYFICPEGGERMSSISVVSHEFGHMLGLPDLYARPDMPGAEGIGVWCTMSTGHGRDGKPLHFCAWSKDQLGWIKPCIIDPRVKQKLILSPIESSPNECFKVLVRPDASEYLLLENRRKTGYDRDIPGEGLLIWRVVDGKPILEESHGIGGPDGPMRFLGSVPYPSKANSAFTPYTTPSSKPAKPGGVPVHITNIRRLPDGRITFHIGYEYL
jgi:M6 family metalloprotease-like protein